MEKRTLYFIAFPLLFFVLIFIMQKNMEATTARIQRIKQDPVICVAKLVKTVSPNRGAYYSCTYVCSDIPYRFETDVLKDCLGSGEYVYFVYEKGKPQNYVGVITKEDYREFGLALCDTIKHCK